MEQHPDQAVVRELLAAERTFLAWVRTGIGVMAFGFVVVKFSLFVKQLAIGLDTTLVMPNKGYSGIIGISLVIIGAVICSFSYIRHRQSIKQIQNRSFKYNGLHTAILATVILAMSLLLIYYLILSV